MYYNCDYWENVVGVMGLDNDAYGKSLLALYGIIKAGLAHKDNGVRKKYEWLHKEYVAAIEQRCRLTATLASARGSPRRY